MNKPDDVSAEAWEEAKSRTTDIERRVWGDDDFLAVCEAIARAIDAAIAKERERAAKIAEGSRVAWSSAEYFGGFNDGCNAAANAIRKGA